MISDLHRHLDGSLRPSTVVALAGGREIPDLAFFPGMGLQAALSRFDFTLSLLREPTAVRRVAAEMCEDAAAEGVSTLEIRFAPQLHGESWAAYVDAAVEGAAGRAGVILCVLYGQDPDVAERLVDLALARPGVVGMDLAGGPSPSHRFGMIAYEAAFRRAREGGLGLTVHAGEGRPPQEIRVAVERLGAQRVGHGTTLLEDPSVVDLLLERGVTVEANLTSNWHVGAIPSIEAHPLPRWLALGIRATVCADNTLLSQTDARRELALAAALPGMTPALLARAVAAGHEAAFRRG